MKFGRVYGFLVCLLCAGSITSTFATEHSFGFYFLKDGSRTVQEVRKHELSDLELTDKPWLSAEDIVGYDFSSHTIRLTDDVGAFLPTHDLLLQSHVPFVIVVDGSPLFLGNIRNMASSVHVDTPFFISSPILRKPPGVLRLRARSAGTPEEEEKLQRLKTCLENLGLLHRGISCSLDSVQITNRAADAQVTYTITFTNLDTDILLVLDPQRTGCAQFHQFVMGPLLQSTHGTKQYDIGEMACLNPGPAAPVDREAWFTPLAPGEVMTRTLALAWLQPIKPGIYRTSLTLGSPLVDTQRPSHGVGRYWVGYIGAESGITIVK